MDDYAKYYYQRVGNDKGDYGDISGRKELRQKLGCKSFEWYLKNIYPELFIPGESVAHGEVRSCYLFKLKDLKITIHLYFEMQDFFSPLFCITTMSANYLLMKVFFEIITRTDPKCRLQKDLFGLSNTQVRSS